MASSGTPGGSGGADSGGGGGGGGGGGAAHAPAPSIGTAAATGAGRPPALPTWFLDPTAREEADFWYDLHPTLLRQREEAARSDLGVRMVARGASEEVPDAPRRLGAERARARRHIVNHLAARAVGGTAAPSVGAATRGARTCAGRRFLPLVPTVPNALPARAASRMYNTHYGRSGRLLVASSQDEIRVLDGERPGVVVRALDVGDATWTITSVDSSPDDGLVAYSSLHPVVYLASLRSADAEPTALSLGTRAYHAWETQFGVYQTRFSPDGTELVAACSGGAVRVADVERGTVVCTARIHGDDVNAVTFATPAGGSASPIVSGSDDGAVRILDRRLLPASGDMRAAGVVATLRGHSEGVTSVDAAGDGVYVVSNGKDQCAKLWDLRRAAASAPARPVRASFDYRWEPYPGTASLPVRHTPDDSVMTYVGHSVHATLIRAYFSPLASTGQRYIVTGSAVGGIHFYDMLSGDLVAVAPHADLVRDVAWHPYAPVLAAASFNHTVPLYTFDGPAAASAAATAAASAGCAAATRTRRAFQRCGIRRAPAGAGSVPVAPSGAAAAAADAAPEPPDAALHRTASSSSVLSRGRRRTGIFDDYGAGVVTGAAAAAAAAADDAAGAPSAGGGDAEPAFRFTSTRATRAAAADAAIARVSREAGCAPPTIEADAAQLGAMARLFGRRSYGTRPRTVVERAALLQLDGNAPLAMRVAHAGERVRLPAGGRALADWVAAMALRLGAGGDDTAPRPASPTTSSSHGSSDDDGGGGGGGWEDDDVDDVDDTSSEHAA